MSLVRISKTLMKSNISIVRYNQLGEILTINLIISFHFYREYYFYIKLLTLYLQIKLILNIKKGPKNVDVDSQLTTVNGVHNKNPGFCQTYFIVIYVPILHLEEIHFKF